MSKLKRKKASKKLVLDDSGEDFQNDGIVKESQKIEISKHKMEEEEDIFNFDDDHDDEEMKANDSNKSLIKNNQDISKVMEYSDSKKRMSKDQDISRLVEDPVRRNTSVKDQDISRLVEDSARRKTSVKDQDISRLVEEPDKKKLDQSADTQIENSSNSTVDGEMRRNLPDCPFCSKDFRNALSSARISHLKACAKRKGVPTEKLMDVVNMERKHAKERKDMGLKTPSPVQPKSRKTTNARPKQRNDADDGVDPDLALALALSLSSAAATGPSTGQTSGQMSGQISGQISSMCVNPPTSSTSQAESQKMWLPQAPKDPPKRRGRKAYRPPTILETRTAAERERLIGDRAGHILFPENPISLSPRRRSWDGGRMCSTNLLRLQDESLRLWNYTASSNVLSPRKLIVSELSKYFLADNETREPEIEETNPPVEKSPAQTVQQTTAEPSFSRLSSDLLKLLKSSDSADVRILCRNEKVTMCHKHILQARSSVLLNEIIIESSGDQKDQYIVLSNFDQLVVQVMLEYIYGGIFNLHKLTSSAELVELRNLTKMLGLSEMIDCLGKIQIEEVEDEGEEEKPVEKEKEDDKVEKEDEDEFLEDATDSDVALDALVDELSQVDHVEPGDDDREDGQDAEDADQEGEEEEWESFCEVFSQRQRGLSIDDSNDGDDKDDDVEDIDDKEEKEPNTTEDDDVGTENIHEIQDDIEPWLIDSDEKGEGLEASPYNGFGIDNKPEKRKSFQITPLKDVSRKKSKTHDEDAYLPTPEKQSSPPLESLFKSETALILETIKIDLEEGSNVQVCMEQLLDMEVTVDDLRSTGIGKIVKKMKTQGGEIEALSRRIVKKWIKLIDQTHPQQAFGSQSRQSSQYYQLHSEEVEPDGDQFHLDQGDDGQEDSDRPGQDRTRSTECSFHSDLPDLELSSSTSTLSRIRETSHQKSTSLTDFNDIEPEPHIPEIDEFEPYNQQDIPDQFDDDLDVFDNGQDANNVDHHDDLNDSDLWKSENDPFGESTSEPAKQTSVTPRSKTPVNNRLGMLKSPACTPLPDYESMLTPQLRAELKRFGLKAVPRRKAVLFLQHIYNETHPYVSDRGSIRKATPVGKNLQKRGRKPKAVIAKENLGKIKTTKPKASPEETKKETKREENSQEFGDVDEDMFNDNDSEGNKSLVRDPEELTLETVEDDDLVLSQVPDEGCLFDQLKDFITSRPSLHQNILLYKPIWFAGFVSDVKEAGIRCKKEQVLHYLNKTGILFRYEKVQPRKNRSPKKKSPKKKSPKKLATK